MRPAVLTLALLLLAAPALPQEEKGSTLEPKRVEIVRKLVTELEQLAVWCAENKLLGYRDECYRVIVRVASDHKLARKILKYSPKGDGTWVQRPYRPPLNKNEKLEPEFWQRYTKAKDQAIAALHEALVQAAKDERPEVRDRVIDDILAIDPDDEGAHKLRGEVSLEGEWVLEETATAKRRYRELRQAARDAIDAVEAPQATDPTDEENSLGVKWLGGFQGEWWRALGTVNPHELERAVKVMDASLPFFNEVFDTRTGRPTGCGFYLLRGQGDAETVLRKHPDFEKHQVAYFLKLKAAWIPRKHVFFQWNDNPGVRLDGAVRNSIGLLFMKTFDIDTRRGWVWESMGLYLDYHLTGSHRTVFVTQERTTAKRRDDFDIEKRMKEPGANWMLLARQLVDKELNPDIEITTAKPVERMEPEDLIYGHALAAFVIEGYPEKAGVFLQIHGVGQPLRDTVSTVFGLPIPKFVERFHRWLREVT
ncbi:MAG: hypothetical protein ACYTDY_00305 [Planctomycetota bacterium]|jgi:hypothetical protein